MQIKLLDIEVYYTLIVLITRWQVLSFWSNMYVSMSRNKSQGFLTQYMPQYWFKCLRKMKGSCPFFACNGKADTLGSSGYFFLIDISPLWGEKNNLWSQEHATSFPCEKSVQKLNWVTDWILPCPQGISNVTMTLIGYIEQLHCVGLVRYLIRISHGNEVACSCDQRLLFSPRRFAPR